MNRRKLLAGISGAPLVGLAAFAAIEGHHAVLRDDDDDDMTMKEAKLQWPGACHQCRSRTARWAAIVSVVLFLKREEEFRVIHQDLQ